MVEICGAAWRRVRRVGLCLLAVSLAAAVLVIAPASPVSSQTDSGGWWDGSEALTAAPPGVVEQGWCSSYGGWLGLFAGGPLAKVCAGDTAGVVSGSPRGVGWFEGFDADGKYVAVELFGGPTVVADTYRVLGEFDVVFEGGTFAVDFSHCTYRTGNNWSSCHTLVSDTPLASGGLVGAAATGTEWPTRSLRVADESTPTPAAERAALVAIYNATAGSDWTDSANWNTAAPVSEWYGVTTNSDGSVTHLSLSTNGLSGSIPAAVGDLTNLQALWLGFNDLSGSIPVELGDLTLLETLHLGQNSLSGRIPADLGDLSDLVLST